MAKTRDYMDYLDDRVEIAPANSQEEYQAAETIASVLRDHKLETSIEEFGSHPFGQLVLPILMCVGCVALVVAGLNEGPARYICALLCVAASALQLFVYVNGTNPFANFGPSSQSQNVVAVHRATGPKVVKGARPIVVVAHYDTPRESLLRKGALARYGVTLRKMSVWCSTVLIVAVLFQIMGFVPSIIRTVFWAAGLIAAAVVLVVNVSAIADCFLPYTLGSNDNKSSVAALLSLANKVRPGEDSVSRLYGDRQEPQPRQAEVAAAAPAEPRRVEIVEEVVGARHGENVIRALGILPPSCELIYEEPRVTVVEEPVAAPAAEDFEAPSVVVHERGERVDEAAEGAFSESNGRDHTYGKYADKGEEQSEPYGTEEAERTDAYDYEDDYQGRSSVPAPLDDDEFDDAYDYDAEDEYGDDEQTYAEDEDAPAPFEDDYDAEDDETYSDASDAERPVGDEDEDAELTDSDEYDEDYDEEGDGGPRPNVLGAASSWISSHFATLREHIAAIRDAGLEIERGENLDEEYEEWEEDYDEDDLDAEDSAEESDEDSVDEDLDATDESDYEDTGEIEETDEEFDEEEDADADFEEEDESEDFEDDEEYETGYDDEFVDESEEEVDDEELEYNDELEEDEPEYEDEFEDDELEYDDYEDEEFDASDEPEEVPEELDDDYQYAADAELVDGEEVYEDELEEDISEEEEQDGLWDDELDDDGLEDDELEDDEYDYDEDEEYGEDTYVDEDDDELGEEDELEFSYENQVSDTGQDATYAAPTSSFMSRVRAFFLGNQAAAEEEPYDNAEYEDESYEVEDDIEEAFEDAYDDEDLYGDVEDYAEFEEEMPTAYEPAMQEEQIEPSRGETLYTGYEEYAEYEEYVPYEEESTDTDDSAETVASEDNTDYEYEYVYVYVDEDGNEIELSEDEVPPELLEASGDDEIIEVANDEDYEVPETEVDETEAYNGELADEEAWASVAIGQDVADEYVEEEAKAYPAEADAGEYNPYEEAISEEEEEFDSRYMDAEIVEQLDDWEEDEQVVADQQAFEDEPLAVEEDNLAYDDNLSDRSFTPRPHDPNMLHFDREEDADIVPRDTTGLDFVTESYEMYADEQETTPPREKPAPVDDPAWGVSTYQPARPVMNIARRAALYDIPDPSGSSLDPFAPLANDAFEDYADDYDDVPQSSGNEQNGFWGDPSASAWKGGATVRADLRDEEEPLYVDAEDLQEAILELGDEFLIAHDIWFVATGASEVGHAGIQAFLDEHRRDIRGSFLVNLDSVGAGSLALLVREGLNAPRKADRRLIRTLSSIADDLHIPLDTAIFGGDERESASCMRSRVRAVTLAGLDENDQPALSHTQDDIPENVDPIQVSRVVRMITELIRRS